MPAHPHVLVATLGGQPQIVTFTLDLLLQQGFPISEVIVIHPRATSPSRLYHSLVHLNAEFVGGTYAETKQPIHFHSCVLEVDGRPIDDISDDAHADGTLNTIHHLLGDLKRRGCHIHLSTSGGRRLMSLLAISVASLNFDRYDHIWHIYTPAHITEQVKDGASMHVSPGSGVRLIQGQFIALGAYIYNPAQSFRIVQDEQRTQMEGREHTCCKAVANLATPAQLKVLQAFARGLRPQQVADELSIVLVTVHSHKTALLSYCRNTWNIPDEERLDYHFLRGKFARYFHHDE